ncbi:hypothetical protein [Enemella sp. A6]|uniref:hypothetical protein n=1 Tax=Enemella sp. A6 TaxID=3440152 RepID=UPI003EBC7C42
MIPSLTSRALLAGVIGALSLTACAAGETPPTEVPSETVAQGKAGEDEREVSSLRPRALLAHDKGLTLIDLTTGDTVLETERPGFKRLNQAGNGRHLLVTEGDKFTVYDGGIESQPHGDHDHKYEYNPGPTEVSYAAPKAGHAVVHAEHTVLFSDGTGEITVLPTADIAKADAKTEKFKTEEAHHGVALRLTDGSLLTTQGNEDARTTVQQLRDGKPAAETKDCPGVHGEAAAAPNAKGDVVAFGCENGPVIFRDGAFHKVKVADAYARSGNLFGSHDSPIVLADYKVDKDAEKEEPTRVALIDTRTDELKLVELGSSYWFRSFTRGEHGEGLVLTQDGKLQVIDLDQGTVIHSIEVMKPWTQPDDWQEPGPLVKVADHRAYVVDTEGKQIVVVDFDKGTVDRRIPLEHAPGEMEIVTGSAGHKH